MDITGLVLELLKQKRTLTPLEQNILDIYDVLIKNPFDMKSAHQQALKNDANYKDICAQIAAMPTTVVKTSQTITEADVRYNLNWQLGMMAEKELEVLKGEQ